MVPGEQALWGIREHWLKIAVALQQLKDRAWRKHTEAY